MSEDAGVIVELRRLRNQAPVFRNRAHAGWILAEMLEEFRDSGAVVMAVPAGGVPVAAEVAGQLELTLDVAVVSKITLPWNTEAGYGAVAFDGTVRINHGLARQVRLSERQMADGLTRTTVRVQRRARRLRGDRPWPELAERAAILVDDGLASGFTMLVAVEALRGLGAGRLVVAVPTAPDDTVAKLAERVDALYCANIREERPFAVADAYRSWSDVSEVDAVAALKRFGPGSIVR